MSGDVDAANRLLTISGAVAIGFPMVASIFIASSFLGWLGWTIGLAFFGVVLFALGKAATEAATGVDAADHLAGKRRLVPDDENDDDVGVDLDEIALDHRWSVLDEGVVARFTYIDRYGEVTDREIRNWRSDGAYVRGFCLSRRESRTFRKDRIEDWELPT